MLCVMWNLFTVGSLQFPNDNTIDSLEANQNRPNPWFFTLGSMEQNSTYMANPQSLGFSYGL